MRSLQFPISRLKSRELHFHGCRIVQSTSWPWHRFGLFDKPVPGCTYHRVHTSTGPKTPRQASKKHEIVEPGYKSSQKLSSATTRVPKKSNQKPRKRLYTREETLRLAQCLIEGRSWLQISQELDRSIVTLRHRASTLGLTHLEQESPESQAASLHRIAHVNYDRRLWDDEDDKRLLELRASSMTWQMISREFPTRTPISCSGRHSYLLASMRSRPRRGSPNLYTKAEDQFIKAGMKAGLSIAQIAKDLPGRKPKGIMYRQTLLRDSMRDPKLAGLYHRVPWSDEETDKLMKIRQTSATWKEVAKRMPGRSVRVCRARYFLQALEAKIDPMPTRSSWSAEETDQFLKAYVAGETWSDILARFPHRTLEACKSKLARERRSSGASLERPPSNEEQDL